jgi:GAF domain-containing protein
MIRRIFSPPLFNNDEDNFRAKFINGFAWAAIALLTLTLIPYMISPGGDLTVVVLSALIAVMLSALYLLRRGNVNASGWVIVILGWLGIGTQAFTADGVKDVIVVAYIAIGLLASIVISQRAGSVVILVSIGVIVALALREANGLFQARVQDPIIYGRDLSFAFITIAILIYFSTTSLRDAIRRANQSEGDLRSTNESLRELNQTLEGRVASRTAELEVANQRNERRAKQFEAIAQVARAITSNQNLDELLPLLVHVTSEKFGFYHAGIFLLDANREFAELRAANSDGGKRMMQRKHKLGIGQTGIVGYVAATGNPRIALDVGADAAFFNNPDLPDTHSEMALPLRVSGNLIGVLDVQSTESNAFNEEDIEILSTLADQVAIAIQNSRSYETTQKFLEEAQRTSGSYLQDSWRVLRSQNEVVGYSISGSNLKPLGNNMETTSLSKVAERGASVVEHGEHANLAVPIWLAGNIVGVVNVQLPETHEWEADEIDIAEAVADRLSLALESATLLEATQKRAEIERLTADITGKIGSTTQFDSIIRTAAEELSRVLGGSDVLVQIQTTTDSKETERAIS